MLLAQLVLVISPNTRNWVNIQLITPYPGWNSHFHTMADATSGMAQASISTIVTTYCMIGPSLAMNCATAIPNSTVPATQATVNPMVRTVDAQNATSESTLPYVENPVKSNSPVNSVRWS